MSLREALRATVARCTPQQMQHATFPAGDATSVATAVQQVSTVPMEVEPFSATTSATGMQQGVKTDATKGLPMHVAPLTSCNSQPGSLTAHRITADLIQAAMRVCDRYADDDAARQEMREQCLSLPPHLQADLLEHFRGVRRGTD